MKHRWEERYCWARYDRRRPTKAGRFTASFLERRMQQHTAHLLQIEQMQAEHVLRVKEATGDIGNEAWKALSDEDRS